MFCKVVSVKKISLKKQFIIIQMIIEWKDDAQTRRGDIGNNLYNILTKF